MWQECKNNGNEMKTNISEKQKDRTTNKQLSLLGNKEFPSFEEIMVDYSKEFYNYITPKGDNVFGFWMQTLADLELLKLELEGLTKRFKINPTERTVDLEDGKESIRLRIAHLEKVGGKPTLYAEIVDKFGDTNAYAFHNLYPFKGKFYPRVVRTLINSFGLNSKSLILDPFNGSGTTTHEASIMGIESVGIDITPIGTILAEIKNELLFLKEKDITFSWQELLEILRKIENKEWKHPNPTVYKLMLILYFDTIDAFARTSRYNKKGKEGLFNQKYRYILECYRKLMELKEKFGLEFKKAKIIHGDVLELKNFGLMKEKFDAVITSPPYYFSIDYVGKDKLAYEYLGIEMKEIESKYLGMKNNIIKSDIYGNLPPKVIRYYEDLKESIENIFLSLKSGGRCAIIVGDSTVYGKKIPTTVMTKRFCEEVGFKFDKLIFNPLLGARNRAIRGESIIICTKP
ncbi:MAG: DNA methyltransferase [Candidatus Pacearchaeota archaeon]